MPTGKGEEKNKTCRKATNPHLGEVFGGLNSSPHFPPLCQVRQKKRTCVLGPRPFGSDQSVVHFTPSGSTLFGYILCQRVER